MNHPGKASKSGTRIVILTGAGVSADSGVATFRDAGGLWEGHRPEDVATPEAWQRDPALVWRFYQMRRAQLATVQPNPAHHALAELQGRLCDAGVPCTLVTQNVDDLHQRASATTQSAPALLAMHGQIAVLRCEMCGHRREDRQNLDPDRFVPCPACAYPRLRPDVVWFGEVPRHLDEIAEAVAACTHFLAIGTSGVVYPAAGFLALARGAGAQTWVNSLERPDNLHPDDTFLPGRAADVIPAQVARWVQAWTRS